MRSRKQNFDLGATVTDGIRLYYANAGLNVTTDLLVAVLPIKAILSLRISKRQKTALIVILTLGWFVCIVSILRLHALYELAQHNDSTWYGAATAYWSAIEVNLAIVCASTPALKPLVIRIIPAFSSRRRSSGSGDSSNTTQRPTSTRSFVPIKVKTSQSTMDSTNTDLEKGRRDPTAPPSVRQPNAQHARHVIHITHNLEQHSNHESPRNVSEDSQQDLVNGWTSPSPYNRSY